MILRNVWFRHVEARFRRDEPVAFGSDGRPSGSYGSGLISQEVVLDCLLRGEDQPSWNEDFYIKAHAIVDQPMNGFIITMEPTKVYEKDDTGMMLGNDGWRVKVIGSKGAPFEVNVAGDETVALDAIQDAMEKGKT